MIVVNIKAKKLELHAPFYPTLPARSKAIGGEWVGEENRWTFPLSEEAALRALCMDIWAVDGTPEASESIVDVEICVDERAPVRTVFLAHRQPVYLVGREIAAALKSRKAPRPGRAFSF
jgi:hypothetical protein